jgi:hypothetical protein
MEVQAREFAPFARLWKPFHVFPLPATTLYLFVVIVPLENSGILSRRARMKQDAESFDQGWRGCMQFGEHRAGETPKQRLAFICQTDEDAAMILLIALALNQMMLGQTINQFDRAVMLYLQPLGYLANRRLASRWQALHRQQQLMLLRLQANQPCLSLAKVDEAT